MSLPLPTRGRAGPAGDGRGGSWSGVLPGRSPPPGRRQELPRPSLRLTEQVRTDPVGRSYFFGFESVLALLFDIYHLNDFLIIHSGMPYEDLHNYFQEKEQWFESSLIFFGIYD